MLPDGFVPLGPTEIDPDAAYPRGVAVLDVVAVHDRSGERFELWGRCCCVSLDRTAPDRHRRPGRLDVGELIDRTRGESPAETHKRLKNWSRTKSELQSWLHGLSAVHKQDFALVVRDTTDFGIPWELFWLVEDEQWLGSLVPMTRWVSVAPPEPTSAAGEVLAYVAHGEMQADLGVLKDLGASVTETLWDLFERLSEPGPALSLVYAACHGTFRESSTEFVLDEVVSVADLDSARLARLAGGGGLVFLNACHSGRLMYDPDYNDATQRGFADALVRAGASGFIGTLGAVGEGQARRFLEELVTRLRAHPEAPVASVIRDVRREYGVRQSPRPGDVSAARDLLPFFYTFMYAYYGGPHDTATLPSERQP